MGKIIAIGGGDINPAGRRAETYQIDCEIVRLADQADPKLLFLPTASGDAESYVEVVQAHFGGKLGCRVEALRLIADPPGPGALRRRILGADIIYVGGGNTLRMMTRWRELGVDALLREAYERGIVLSGLSAGSICWFRYGSSDSRKFTNPSAGLIRVTGLGLLGALHCPHYDAEQDRKPHLDALMQRTSGVAIALDNCCALEVVDDEYRILSSKPEAKAYKVFCTRGEIRRVALTKRRGFAPLGELLAR